MNEHRYSDLPTIEEIIKKRKKMQRCCEGCADPNNDWNPPGECKGCDVLTRYCKELDDIATELKALPYTCPITDDQYLIEFVCDSCKFGSFISYGGNWHYPADQMGWCALLDESNDDHGESMSKCKGRFFIQDPKKDTPYMTYNQYLGIDPLPTEEEQP
jgi:hypothetical protein